MYIHSTLLGMFDAPLYWVSQSSSGLDVARDLIKNQANLISGTTIITEHQTQGRGRRGNTWVSSPNAGLWAVFLFNADMFSHNNYNIKNATDIMQSTVIATVHTIESLLSQQHIPTEEITIKWPNDIFITDKKISGVLVESLKNWVVVGLGINLVYANILSEAQSSKLDFNAPITALDKYGITCLPQELYTLLLPHYHRAIGLSQQDRNDFFNNKLWKKNQKVQFITDNTTESVTILGVHTNGFLLVKDQNKKITLRQDGRICAK